MILMKNEEDINLENLMNKLYSIVENDLEVPGHFSHLTIEAIKILVDYERTK